MEAALWTAALTGCVIAGIAFIIALVLYVLLFFFD